MALDQDVARILWARAVVALAEVDPATHRFVAVNPAFCEVLDYSEHQLLERTWMDVTHPADVRDYREALDHVLASRDGKGYTMITRYISAMNKVVPIKLRVDPVTTNEGSVRLLIAQLAPIDLSDGSAASLRDPTAKEWLRDNWKVTTGVGALLAGLLTLLTEIVRALAK